MSKTLADMSAEERADCVGMWAEHAHPHYDGLEVIIDSDHDSVTTISTKSGQQYIVVGEVMRHITPRFDLPRAWTPGGEPVPLGKVARLQSAVQQMLCELNIYQEQENIGRVREVALDTIETYGLTKEDME